MKCVAKLNADGELNSPGSRILCDVDTDHIYQGSSLCFAHVIEAFDRTQVESGLGGLIKGIEKITLDDVLKISSMARPLMEAFSSGAMGAMPTATPGVCTKTIGCRLLAGHVSECSLI